jgi:c-di-GMP-binding flagellar brake protein YcgR
MSDAVSPETPKPAATSASGKPAAGAENRASVRKLVSLKVRVLMPSGKMMEGRTQDVSTGGVGLVLADPLTPQSQVQIALQLPRPKVPGQYDVITGPGKVVFQVMRGANYQIGVQWLSLDGKTLALLQSFTEHATRPKQS